MSKALVQFDRDPEYEKWLEEELQKSIYGEEFVSSGKKRRKKPKAWDFDPIAIISIFDYKEKDPTLSFELLRRMAERNIVVCSIINTRINQVSRFSYPARVREDKIGFKIRPRDPREKITDAVKKRIIEIEDFLLYCGLLEYNYIRDQFGDFLKKIVRDRLIYDAMAVEVVRDRNGRLAMFHAVDASTIRLAVPDDAYREDGRFRELSPTDIGYVQVVQGKRVAEFTFDELGYGVFYPRTSIDVYGYGFSELEMAVKEITWQLYASSYNGRYFSQGALPKGILNFKGGNLTKEKLDDFRRQWQAQVAGLTGAWKMPIVSSPDIQFIELQKSNSDMEFSAWMDYLVNVICGVYCIDPSEINFPSRGGSGDSHESALFDNSYEVKLRQSRDKGLYPLLDFIANFINRHIVSKIDPDFVFVFEGLDRRMGIDRLKAQEIEVRTFKTINEIRREEDMEPLPDGDMLLDSTFVNYRLQMKQMEYQLKQQELKLLAEAVELRKKLVELAQMEAQTGVDTNKDMEELAEQQDEILRLVETMLGSIKEEDDEQGESHQPDLGEAGSEDGETRDEGDPEDGETPVRDQ